MITDMSAADQVFQIWVAGEDSRDRLVARFSWKLNILVNPPAFTPHITLVTLWRKDPMVRNKGNNLLANKTAAIAQTTIARLSRVSKGQALRVLKKTRSLDRPGSPCCEESSDGDGSCDVSLKLWKLYGGD